MNLPGVETKQARRGNRGGQRAPCAGGVVFAIAVMQIDPRADRDLVPNGDRGEYVLT